MRTDEVDVELLVTLARLGQDDRDLYRQLRAEAWEMVAQRHREMTAEERAAWTARSS
jgi:hypothetical protein